MKKVLIFFFLFTFQVGNSLSAQRQIYYHGLDVSGKNVFLTYNETDYFLVPVWQRINNLEYECHWSSDDKYIVSIDDLTGYMKVNDVGSVKIRLTIEWRNQQHTSSGSDYVECTINVIPCPPTGLAANNISKSGCTLNWNANNTKDEVDGYYIVMNNVQLLTLYKTTSATITGLNPCTNYKFQVFAYNNVNRSNLSSSISVTTYGNKPPTNLKKDNITQNSFTLSWTGTGCGVLGYYIYQNGNKLPSLISGTSTIISGLNANTDYEYKVGAYYGSGDEYISENSFNVLTLPNQATNLNSTNTACTTYNLSWTAPSGTGALSYNIYQGTEPIGTSTSTNYTVNGLAESTNYSFYIIAHNQSGNSVASNIHSLTTISKPTAPTDFTIRHYPPGYVLTWTKSIDVVDGYNVIQRSPVSGLTNFTTSNSFFLGPLTSNTVYIYSIEAVKGLCYADGATIGFNTGYLKNEYQGDVDYPLQVINMDDITIFPNPVKDILNIIGISDFGCEIFDIKGSLLMKQNNCSGSIDVCNLKPGMYQIKISSKDKVWTEKIIKE
jgi:hypothetical protein